MRSSSDVDRADRLAYAMSVRTRHAKGTRCQPSARPRRGRTSTASSTRSRTHTEPIQITGKRGNAVLVSEADWQALQETLFLVSIPGMRESILEGMATPPHELEDEPGW